MDKNTIFMYHCTMNLYYNPDICILLIGQMPLTRWFLATKVSFWRLYWNSVPGAIVRCQGRTIALTPERIILVPPNMSIGQRLIHVPVMHFYVHFLINPSIERLLPKIHVFKAEASVLNMIKTVRIDEKDCLISNPRLMMAVRGLIYCLLAQIPAAEFRQRRISMRLAENMTFIEAHIQQAVSNSEIARHMGVSVNSMLRHYQHELGLSPQAYLRQKRVEKACQLLHDPQRSIKQIAEETGFCDRYYFSRVFKSLQDMTPAQYRSRFG